MQNRDKKKSDLPIGKKKKHKQNGNFMQVICFTTPKVRWLKNTRSFLSI
jgi:hypothetical protein